jgi:hypothetical protein
MATTGVLVGSGFLKGEKSWERLDGRFSRRIARGDRVACLGVDPLLKVNPEDPKDLQPAATD